MGLYDELVIEVGTWVEHSADTSERTHQLLSPKHAMEKVAKVAGRLS